MRMVIGSGGRVINELIKRTGASFDVQPNGYLLIYHSSEEKLEGVCLEIVKLIGKNER